jgi:hypothetical protein
MLGVAQGNAERIRDIRWAVDMVEPQPHRYHIAHLLLVSRP